MAAEQEVFIHVLISLAILLFAAKIFAELFNKLKLPAVLGELLAGIIVGPFALGSLPLFDGQPLVILNETVRQIGEISGIVILFIAGLEITPREFLKGGIASFTVGACGVVVAFFVWYYFLAAGFFHFWFGDGRIYLLYHFVYGCIRKIILRMGVSANQFYGNDVP